MRSLLPSATALTVLLCAACATGTGDDWRARDATPARDTPAQFVTQDGTLPVNACRSPLLDPRDGTRIRLVRSGGARPGEIGDYEVPGSRYGVTTGSLLRIDCSTGQALGIVSG